MGPDRSYQIYRDLVLGDERFYDYFSNPVRIKAILEAAHENETKTRCA